MKLFPPDPEITLYETGFGDADPFNRLGTGKALSGLVERIEDPLVIALDGGWGSGKTWFLKRWVGAHGLENGGRATTVYFDAFAHDFMDDPLIALTGVIGERLPKEDDHKTWSKVKTAAARLAKPIARIGLAVATGSATEVVGPILDAAFTATSKEIEAAADAFWKQEDGKRAAMAQFRSALEALTKAGEDGGGASVPLVVVVDELDRCRPDYALALLEVIKHFFSVPNVHFVLGVSLAALAHSVRARYGAGMDAERYLRKFVSVTMRLPDQAKEHDTSPLVLSYFRGAARAMGVLHDVEDLFHKHLELVVPVHRLSMRDMNQVLSKVVLMNPEAITRLMWGWQECLVSMVLFRFVAPDLESKAMQGTLTVQDVNAFYGIKPEMLNDADGKTYRRQAEVTQGLWESIITNGARPENNRDEFSRAFNKWGSEDLRSIPRRIERQFLNAVVLGKSEQ